MNSLPWYAAGLGAALLWGVHYPLLEHALKRVSLVTVLVLTVLPVLVVALFYRETLWRDLGVLMSLDWPDRGRILLLSLTSLSATVMLFMAIGSRNATLASLIEITYPVFVVLFTWLFFRQIHVTPAAALGGVLVMAGAALIIWSHP
ncbi:MAG TPA: EamA family transporter [Thioalkalivibrio sp.]|nr:EamA family transporter [Thioalkalivibrio sp.]